MIRSKFSFFSFYLSCFFILVCLTGGIYLLSNLQIVLHNKFGGANGPAFQSEEKDLAGAMEETGKPRNTRPERNRYAED
jgi:hypothetical protein